METGQIREGRRGSCVRFSVHQARIIIACVFFEMKNSLAVPFFDMHNRFAMILFLSRGRMC